MNDLEIAKQVKLQNIVDVARQSLDIPLDAITPFGTLKAKLALDYLLESGERSTGKLVLVTGMSPTPAGEGKTTTTIGLSDALNQLGKSSVACLREPSLGPNFGMKGGAHGGGYAQVAPMDDINLHFTGDLHAVTSAHNLLASLIDNHLYWGNKLGIDVESIMWRRVVDLNDRALRDIDVRVRRQLTRSTGFDITAASELMAVLCLSENLVNLQERLSELVVGKTKSGEWIRAGDLGARSALAVLLKDALSPNLVQSLEHNPVFIHGGPFANIAHGCNSVLATRVALAHADVVVTEAGFGADLGAEKFLNIKCRQTGLWPDVVVVVATVRALKMQGGVPLDELSKESSQAVVNGAENLKRHVANLRKFGFEPIVSVNRFTTDSEEELQAILNVCKELRVRGGIANYWSEGGPGGEQIASEVLDCFSNDEVKPRYLYPDDMPLSDKVRTVAREIYRADGVEFLHDTETELQQFEAMGFGNLPVCIAKTQYSFSSDPNLLGAASGHRLSVREVQLKAGAGFVVVICGNIMTMPGLPRKPAAENLTLNEMGEIGGLF